MESWYVECGTKPGHVVTSLIGVSVIPTDRITEQQYIVPSQTLSFAKKLSIRRWGGTNRIDFASTRPKPRADHVHEIVSLAIDVDVRGVLINHGHFVLRSYRRTTGTFDNDICGEF